MSHVSSSSSGPRVLFVDLSGRRGGAETSLDELICALGTHQSLSLALATARVDAPVPCPTYALPAVRLHRPSRVISFSRSLAALMRARRSLKRIIRDFRPDIVHANGIAALLALPRTTARIFWHVRDWPRNPYATIAARRCDKIIAISKPVAKALRHSLPTSLHTRIRLVENGIDLSRFPMPASALSGLSRHPGLSGTSGPTIGMLAHLIPWKRHDLFIAAADQLRDFRDSNGHPITWVIAGSDLFGEHASYIASLRRAIEIAGLKDRFVWLEGRDGASILQSLGILVHPTPSEPFGRVICEAMARGVPVVACNAAGPGSILEDNVTGFLFAPTALRDGLNRQDKTCQALADRIRFVLTHPKERSQVVQTAAQEVRARYGVDRVADNVAQLLQPARATNGGKGLGVVQAP